MNKIVAIILLVLLYSAPTFGATFEVRPSGGDYTSPGACANAASAGDVCEVYNGTYAEWTQNANGSSVGGYIIVRAAAGQSPIVDGSILLSNNGISFFHIEGLTINGSIKPSSIVWGQLSDHLKIIDNVFNRTSLPVQLKADDVLISGNVFNGLENDAIRVHGSRFVIRENSMVGAVEDPAYHMDFFQSFCSSPDETPPYAAQYGLIENNVMVDASGENAHFSLINGTISCDIPPIFIIHRHNKIHDIGSLGIYIDDNLQAAGAERNTIYNNTFSYLVRGDPSWQGHAATLSGSSNSSFVNNIIADSTKSTDVIGVAPSISGHHQSYNLYHKTGVTLTFSGAASSEVGAVKNQNPLLSNPSGLDFSISSESPARNAGGALTYVATADIGSGTSLIVEKAEFFQPGWGGAEADTIAVGNTSVGVQITGINYSTNTITLASSISRADNDPVYLYALSDGTRVLYGDAPDIGAVPYVDGGTPPPAASRRANAQQSIKGMPVQQSAFGAGVQ